MNFFHVSLNIYIYIYIYIYMYTHTHTHTHIYIYVHFCKESTKYIVKGYCYDNCRVNDIAGMLKGKKQKRQNKTMNKQRVE